MRPQSRRARQRFLKRSQKEEEETERRKGLSTPLNRNEMIVSAIRRNVESAYGFIANPHLTTSRNVNLQLGKMMAWFYFDCPRHFLYHDITSCSMPINLDIHSNPSIYHDTQCKAQE